MRTVIKLHELIYEAIINHSNTNPKLECGGYLFGLSKKTEGGIEVIVTDAYYERIWGTDRKFTFSLSYLSHAKEYLNWQKKLGRGIKLIGCYHSHGEYPAIFSAEDRLLEKTWGKNHVALIYSPSYKKMVGEAIIDRDLFIPARITTFQKNVYDTPTYISNTENNENAVYDNNNYSKVLKKR